MRVLYVLRYYPTLTETFVYREIRGLVARGVEVVVAAVGSREDGDLADELPEVEVVRPPRGAARVLAGAHQAALRRGGGREAWSFVARHQRDKDATRALWLALWAGARGFDRVHAHFAGEAAEWAHAVSLVTGVPWSVTVHAVDLFVPRPSLPELLVHARPVVTVARHHQGLLRREHGIEAALVRCGVEPERYPAADPGEPAPLRVIAVGRDVPKKGLALLAEAARRAGVALRLVSDADPLPPSRVPGALAAAHLFALPCRRAADGDLDGIPVALVEAMAAGLPVLTTPVSGIPELVDEEVGWLVPPDDVGALVGALEEAAGDPAERARRGAAARRRVVEAGFTVAAQVEALLAAWEAA